MDLVGKIFNKPVESIVGKAVDDATGILAVKNGAAVEEFSLGNFFGKAVVDSIGIFVDENGEAVEKLRLGNFFGKAVVVAIG